MKSYTQGRNYYGVITKNTDTNNLLFGDQIANDDYRAICSMKDWPFLERLRTKNTTTNTQYYALPYDCDRVKSVSVVVSGKTYTPVLAPDKTFWDNLNFSTFNSDIPEYYFVYQGQLGIWPIPSSNGSTININQKSRVIDLGIADYTTGTISAVTAGGNTITGSGTTWTSQMVGRYIRITGTDTANTGDNAWYEIASVLSTTSLTIVTTYGGLAIAAGSANYTIAQVPLLPESFQDLPWLYAAGIYWQKEDDPRGAAFLSLHGSIGEAGSLPTGRIKQLVDAYSSPTTNMVIDDGFNNDRDIINPNLLISL